MRSEHSSEYSEHSEHRTARKPHPGPPPKGGETMWRNCCGECCLVLSGMLFGIVGDVVWCCRECCFLYVPTGGTISPNGWDYRWEYFFHSLSLPFTPQRLPVNIEFYVHSYIHGYVHSLFADIQLFLRTVYIVYIKTKTFFLLIRLLPPSPVNRSSIVRLSSLSLPLIFIGFYENSCGLVTDPTPIPSP